ncbi:MAG: universal stress protein [Deltaproteobacteria bacterium]|nr:universal stress protein [Deltaproteobacteria bacterium]
MKILIAVDSKAYSGYAVKEATALAANTWASVTLLGVEAKSGQTGRATSSGSRDIRTAINKYRKQFIDFFPKGECPYTEHNFSYEWIDTGNNVCEEFYMAKSARKPFIRRIRTGSPVKAILAEAKETMADLIITGCDPAGGCIWTETPNTPVRLVNEAPCSVMIVKSEKKIDNIVCCLDNDNVTQASLELINQMVTIHEARLTLVGFEDNSGGLQTGVEKRMYATLRYYQAVGIEPVVEMVDKDSFGPFVTDKRQWGLMAFWLGPQSILGKWLPKARMNRIVKESRASVLILR